MRQHQYNQIRYSKNCGFNPNFVYESNKFKRHQRALIKRNSETALGVVKTAAGSINHALLHHRLLCAADKPTKSSLKKALQIKDRRRLRWPQFNILQQLVLLSEQERMLDANISQGHVGEKSIFMLKCDTAN
jgi:hypothetical protein